MDTFSIHRCPAFGLWANAKTSPIMGLSSSEIENGGSIPITSYKSLICKYLRLEIAKTSTLFLQHRYNTNTTAHDVRVRRKGSKIAFSECWQRFVIAFLGAIARASKRRLERYLARKESAHLALPPDRWKADAREPSRESCATCPWPRSGVKVTEKFSFRVIKAGDGTC